MRSVTGTATTPGRPRAGPLATGYRIVVGLFYIGSAVFNLLVSFPNAHVVYEAFADLAWPGAEQLVREVVLPIAGPFTLAVVAFELVAGALLLGRGRWARLGLWAALGWLAVLVPFLGVYGVANVVLILTFVPLLRTEPDRSLRDLVRRGETRSMREERPLPTGRDRRYEEIQDTSGRSPRIWTRLGRRLEGGAAG